MHTDYLVSEIFNVPPVFCQLKETALIQFLFTENKEKKTTLIILT